jgi:hypothetical protein
MSQLVVWLFDFLRDFWGVGCGLVSLLTGEMVVLLVG